MRPRTEYVATCCSRALAYLQFESDAVWPVYQDDLEEKNSVVYTLVREERYDSIEALKDASQFELDIRTDLYGNLDKLDRAIQHELVTLERGRLTEVQSGLDFVEDSTSRERIYRRRRSVVID